MTRRTKRSPVRVPAVAPPEAAPSNYQDAMKYLAECVNLEQMRASRVTPDLFRLDRIRAILSKLGDPQQSLRCVHVAGTKGKGSTCEMTASCLQACGYAVGVYTSPHLIDVRERIRVNRKLISYADFTRHLGKVAEAAAAIEGKHGPATYFEHMTAMALCHFAEEAVDVAVIEVGLGGRLDSTNVINPEVTAVTSISLDHTQLLGNTVEKIAREKAGIFKPGVPALTIQQKPPIIAAMREVAEKVGAPFQVVGVDIDFSVRFESMGSLRPHARVCLTTDRCAYEHLRVPLRGEHQALNCGLALGILDKLVERGLLCPASKVTKGLERTELAGRLELAWPSPRIMLDCAHNEDSLKCLIKAVGASIPYDSMVVVFGCCADKDVPAMLTQLALGGDKVVFTKAAGTSRAANPADLARKFNELTGRTSQVAKDLPEALTMAAKGVAREDLICVTGSVFLVGEAKKYLAAKKGGTL